MSGPEPLVFDTGPLRHFAQQQWLAALRFITSGRQVVIPESVERELRQQAGNDVRLLPLLDGTWITVDRSDDLPFAFAFAEYERRLAVGTTNLGECGVLALGKTRGWEMVLDDSTPRALADEEGLSVTATVPLLCDAVRSGQVTVAMCEALADDLIANAYYLPFGPGKFRSYVLEQGLLDYADAAR